MAYDEAVSVRLSEQQAERLAAAARETGRQRSDLVRDLIDQATSIYGEQLVAGARAVAYAQDPCPYEFRQGGEHSLIRDAFEVRTFGESAPSGAQERLRKFERWQQDPVVRREALKFAAQTTTTASAIIPPGYLGLFLPPEQGRPLRNAATVQPLTGSSPATPFAVPTGVNAQVTSAGAGGRPFTVGPAGGATLTGAVGTHTQGTNAVEGDLAVATDPVVSPAGKSGSMRLTRELVDGSNPAVDQVALTIMREQYAQQTEGMVYAELNGANGQAGTITAGLVPSGAQVSTVAVATLPAELKAALTRYPFKRGRKARTVAVSANAAAGLADLDTTKVWLQGVAVEPAPQVTGVAATDGQVFILSDADLWAWESPLLTFRFEERAGPANVDVALFGYFATRLLRPVGLASIRVT